MKLVYPALTLFCICFGKATELLAFRLLHTSCDSPAFEDPCLFDDHLRCEGQQIIKSSYHLLDGKPVDINDFSNDLERINAKPHGKNKKPFPERLCIKYSCMNLLTNELALQWPEAGCTVALMNRDISMQQLEMLKTVSTFSMNSVNFLSQAN